MPFSFRLSQSLAQLQQKNHALTRFKGGQHLLTFKPLTLQKN